LGGGESRSRWWPAPRRSSPADPTSATASPSPSRSSSAACTRRGAPPSCWQRPGRAGSRWRQRRHCRFSAQGRRGSRLDISSGPVCFTIAAVLRSRFGEDVGVEGVGSTRVVRLGAGAEVHRSLAVRGGGVAWCGGEREWARLTCLRHPHVLERLPIPRHLEDVAAESVRGHDVELVALIAWPVLR
jgi:hypothetical protein